MDDVLPPSLELNCVVEVFELGGGGGARGLQMTELDDEIDEDDGVVVMELDIDVEKLEEEAFEEEGEGSVV